MTQITVKIDTVSSVTVVFYRQSDNWESLNQYERDDIISAWVNENPDAQAAIPTSSGYTLSWICI
ncbi:MULTISPECIES: hypothetical protein [Klebsiella pneumoniae complex]|uniref:hypothetical protein n=1 Tax=Klebsiella pneumoniae complex TaxID=3390273 RepID=UPI002B0573DA|nr:hypothetical protein [Klebsiella variicola]